jgi:hypothetical protein
MENSIASENKIILTNEFCDIISNQVFYGRRFFDKKNYGGK